MLSSFFITFIYAAIWIWFCGGFTQKKPEKKKTPEEQLGEALSKYLSTLNITKKT